MPFSFITRRGSPRQAKAPLLGSMLLALAIALAVALPAAAQTDSGNAAPTALPGAANATPVPLMTRPSATVEPVVAPPDPTAEPAAVPMAPDPTAPPRDDVALNLPARISGSTVVFDRPTTDGAVVGSMRLNDAVIVIGAVNRDDGRWYHLDSGAYAPAEKVRVPETPPRTFPGRWIDANLTEPVIVTAYEGSTPVYAALAVKGTAAFSTPTGVFRILSRVADETMNSETLYPPVARDAPGGYYLEHVLNTQYVTGDGAAIHYTYWNVNWGYTGSHGCLGVNLADARFFWNFASLGTTVNIHQ